MSKKMRKSTKPAIDQSNQMLLDYAIVQFIKRGRPGVTREIDIVPSKWLNHSKSKDRCTTKFPEASTDPEDNALLHDLVKELADPPEIWKEYTVDILGRASKFIWYIGVFNIAALTLYHCLSTVISQTHMMKP